MEIQLHNSSNENPMASKTIFVEINFLVRKNNSGKTFDRDQKISSGEKNDKKWSQAVTQTQIDFLMEEHNFRLTLLAATTTAIATTATATTTTTAAAGQPERLELPLSSDCFIFLLCNGDGLII